MSIQKERQRAQQARNCRTAKLIKLEAEVTSLRETARRDAETIARLRICAAGLTPVSEDEKRGMERVLAILDRKIAEGGVVSSDAPAVERHDAHYRARWSAFSECAEMLRAVLAHLPQGEPSA